MGRVWEAATLYLAENPECSTLELTRVLGVARNTARRIRRGIENGTFAKQPLVRQGSRVRPARAFIAGSKPGGAPGKGIPLPVKVSPDPHKLNRLTSELVLEEDEGTPLLSDDSAPSEEELADRSNRAALPAPESSALSNEPPSTAIPFRDQLRNLRPPPGYARPHPHRDITGDSTSPGKYGGGTQSPPGNGGNRVKPPSRVEPTNCSDVEGARDIDIRPSRLEAEQRIQTDFLKQKLELSELLSRARQVGDDNDVRLAAGLVRFNEYNHFHRFLDIQSAPPNDPRFRLSQPRQRDQ